MATGTTIFGSDSSNDTLKGTANGERIEGLKGSDSLFGGGGADTLVGGLGDDTYVFFTSSSLDGGNDTVHDVDDAVASKNAAASFGNDRIAIPDLVNVSSLRFGRNGDNLLIGFSGRTITVEQYFSGNGAGKGFIEHLTVAGGLSVAIPFLPASTRLAGSAVPVPQGAASIVGANAHRLVQAMAASQGAGLAAAASAAAPAVALTLATPAL